MRARIFGAPLVVALWLCSTQLARADMWTFVDAQGVKHFASSQLDKRYKLMFRGLPAPDVGSDGADAAAALARAVASSATIKPITNMELSPGFMAIKPYVRSAADANQLDMALLQAVIATESGFNAAAVSPKGAVGLMQVMPATAQRYGLASDHGGTVAAKLTDPKTNINTGARYLRDLVNLFPGQLELAVAAYNAGEGAVQKAGNKIPNFKETQNYVRSVMQLYRNLHGQTQQALRANPTAAQRLASATTGPGARVHGEFHAAPASALAQPLDADAAASDLLN